MKSKTPLALAMTVLGCFLPCAGKATTVLGTDGFDSPTFQPGAFEGQDGWIVAHSGLTTSSAVIQTQETKSGQALQINRASNSDAFWPKRVTSAPSGRLVSIDWDMLYEAPTPSTNGFGPFFGIQVFDDSTGSVRQVASWGVDVAAAELLYQVGNNGNFAAVGPASPDVWRHYRIELDFQNDTYSTFLDGELAVTTPFVEPGGGIDRYTDVDVVAIAAGFDAISQANTGVAYLDNLIVRDGMRGDFNNDGVLDAADYPVWRAQNGLTGYGLAGDANADGQVDAADYWIWANQFGETNALAGPTATIPEPTGLAIALAAASACSLGRRS